MIYSTYAKSLNSHTHFQSDQPVFLDVTVSIDMLPPDKIACSSLEGTSEELGVLRKPSLSGSTSNACVCCLSGAL